MSRNAGSGLRLLPLPCGLMSPATASDFSLPVARANAGPKRREWAVIVGLTLLCLLLPTQNSTADAWYYAACVRHGHELLLPHHLLYNVVGWLWMKVLPASIDTLAALKALNALAYGGVLLVLRSLLRRVGSKAAPVAAWLLLVGSSFGMLRFATENETYILPLLCSLLASRSAGRAATGETGRRGWLWAGAWAAGAALLHQVHAFWGLGLGLGILLFRFGVNSETDSLGGRWRAAGLFALPTLLLVPLAYAAALPGWQLPLTLSNWWHFAFRDLYAGQTGAVPSGATLLLAGISLVRTFGQVHGTTLALLRQPALAGVGLLCLGAGVWALLELWQARQRPRPAAVLTTPATPAAPAAPVAAAEDGRWFGRTHWLVLALQLACAVWAAGNAEFMVMVPALLALLLVRHRWPARPLYLAGAALLGWNLSFGLLPAHRLRLTPDIAPLLTRIQREPGTYWLLTNPNLALNQLHYHTGQAVGPATIWPAPAQLARRRAWSVGRFRSWLAVRRAAGQRVYTDALGGARLLDRAELTQGGADAPPQALLAGYELVRVDSLFTSFGVVYLTEIR